MNLDLMNHGFNTVIIKKEDRLEYYEALNNWKLHLITSLEIEMLKKYLELL